MENFAICLKNPKISTDNFGQLGRKYVKLRHQLTYPNLSDIINLRVFVTGRHLDQVTKTNISFISQKYEHVS